MTNSIINAEAQKDINELQYKINEYKDGKIPEERFKAYRLTRGVYGQRQPGVQMFRIKIPYGKLSPTQLRRIADLSNRYSNGNLHITTRQNIQMHYVQLEDAPEIWRQLEEVGVTTRESCGNTVRGITASALAGVDPNEPFDVSPYAQAVFEYFLRNPVCQDMGRKIKMAFSSSDEDAAFTYIHDFGFIPRIRDGKKGFKVLVAGGLGAQAMMAREALEFLPADGVIPFIESGLRVFDRYGERERRHKARLKYLVDPQKGIGLEGFLKLIEDEQKALPFTSYPIDETPEEHRIPPFNQISRMPIKDVKKYELWKIANVVEQKQEDFYAVKIRIPLGNLDHEKAYGLAGIAEKYASRDIRLTVNQGLLFRYVSAANLHNLFAELENIGLSDPGFDSLADITACPGTDTCNLGVTDSTAITTILENLIRNDYPHLIDEQNIKIKISGCMNSCGQHMVANIGFHGSSLKYHNRISPAMQVVLGGGVDPDGKGYIAEKVIKIPTKRIPVALSLMLDDYEANAEEGEYFNAYFRRNGKIYFYNLLKPLANMATMTDEEYQDWGDQVDFVPEIGIGECAGVTTDLVGTILNDARERLRSAREATLDRKWSNVIYWSYNAFVIGAKGFLLSRDIQCNTHNGIIDDFQTHVYEKGRIGLPISFRELVLQIHQNEPDESFAVWYLGQAEDFLNKVVAIRKLELDNSRNDKEVISDFYRA